MDEEKLLSNNSLSDRANLSLLAIVNSALGFGYTTTMLSCVVSFLQPLSSLNLVVSEYSPYFRSVY